MSKASDPEASWTSAQQSINRLLASCYTIHGAVVGGLLFFVVLINSQAARTALEGNLAIVAVLIQPVPMFITAIVLWRGWRWARLLAVFLPILIGLCSLGQSGPRAHADPVALFCDLQMKNIFGAFGLAIVTAYFVRSDAKKATPRGDLENRG